MLKSACKTIFSLAFLFSTSMPTFSLDERDISSIRIYEYDSLELNSRNASTVTAHAEAAVTFCNKITGLDNGARAMLAQLRAALNDPQPDITKQAAAKGAEGFFGDSTGLVPFTSIQTIAKIKNISNSTFCKAYTFNMKREAEKYHNNCNVAQNKEYYICNAN